MAPGRRDKDLTVNRAGRRENTSEEGMWREPVST